MPFPDEAFAAGVVVGESASWAEEGIALVDRLRLVVPAAVAARPHRVHGRAGAARQGVPRRAGPGPRPPGRARARGGRLPRATRAVEPRGGHRRPDLPQARLRAPRGERSANVHVRLDGGANARFALLFRDFLRADHEARDHWGAFKRRLAQAVPDLSEYGQVKAAAYPLLMRAAEAWAVDTAWDPAATLVPRPDM